MNTGNDSQAAVTDLADALKAFADHAVPPGAAAGDDVWVTIGTPYGIEQRTVRWSPPPALPATIRATTARTAPGPTGYRSVPGRGGVSPEPPARRHRTVILAP
ncbi:hypothetical protein ACWDD9_43445 [Kitasatospora sp. NPDC001119]